MYLIKLIDENIGPIEKLEINFPFSDELPKPVIFVGENGSGKSTVLSNIVDAFYTIANMNYDNALQKSDGGSVKQYFKAISPTEIRFGKGYMFSYIKFAEDTEVNYIFKSGQISDEELEKKCGESFSIGDKNNYKKIKPSVSEKNDPFDHNVLVYFGPERYEKPFWMGEKYSHPSENLHLSVYTNWSRQLGNPISANYVTDKNLQWLLDIIADSRPDVEKTENGYSIVHKDVYELDIFCNSRNNIEQIMSQILGKEVYFSLNSRNEGPSRFRIVEKGTNNIVAPTLDSLSTGQIALFNLFSTIVRYADRNHWHNSVSLSSITGIVVIDEIELHLHSVLQREVLPKLIKLFPKIQFIITSHSPLFILGMEDTFGVDGYEIREMPHGTIISAEMFSEFQKAYDYIKSTRTYQEDLLAKIDESSNNSEALIITEGPSDWRHMKTAFEVLSSFEKNKGIFENLSFSFFEYSTSDTEASLQKVQMGGDNLLSICTELSKVPKDRKYIFIADRDKENINKKMGMVDSEFRDWGNNVYSFLIPIPDLRKHTPNICIEHLYTDEEIKTEVNIEGYRRRLYIGNEFDTRGIALSIDRFCENRNKCGSDKIEIIEGSGKEKVTRLSSNDGINYALSKVNFAQYVDSHRENFRFENFLDIFRIIRAILLEKEDTK